MLDFYNNTYTVRKEELVEVRRLLKKYPEYKGLYGTCVFSAILENSTNLQEYPTLSKSLDKYFEYYNEPVVFLDNEFITDQMVEQNSDIIKLAEIYNNDDCIQHYPAKSLLTELRRLEKQVMRFS